MNPPQRFPRLLLHRFSSALLLFLLAAPPQPAWAAVHPEARDPAEEASATLSRHLRELEASLGELRRLRTLEQSRAQGIGLFSGRFLLPNGSFLGQGSVNWLLGQKNPAQTGIVPIAGRAGLVVSYVVPPGSDLSFLRGRSWTYDDAVAAVAFTLQGQPAQARVVLSALAGLMRPEGTLGFSYQVDSDYFDPRVRTGTLAWVGYAMAFYQRRTGDSSFQGHAERIARYLQTIQHPTGSLRGGPDVAWVSTEHNVDAYFFYREMHRLTGSAGYLATANQIKNSLLANHWVRTSSGGRFLRGLNDPTPSLDANSWGAIFLSAIGRTRQANQALRYVDSTFKNSQRISGSSARLTGYSPDSARRTVWLEGTAGVAVAYLRAGQTHQADAVLENLGKLQTTWQSQGRWRGAFPYAMPRYRDADGDTFSELESVASTAWLLIATAARQGAPFWER